MFSRSLALLLALAFFWSSVTAPGPVELTSAVANSLSTTRVLAVLQSEASSVPDEQHRPSDDVRHDELASPADGHPVGEPATQPPTETGLDSPALLARRAETQTCLLTMAEPAPQLLVTWLAPHLEGLRRPPRSADPTV